MSRPLPDIFELVEIVGYGSVLSCRARLHDEPVVVHVLRSGAAETPGLLARVARAQGSADLLDQIPMEDRTLLVMVDRPELHDLEAWLARTADGVDRAGTAPPEPSPPSPRPPGEYTLMFGGEGGPAPGKAAAPPPPPPSRPPKPAPPPSVADDPTPRPGLYTNLFLGKASSDENKEETRPEAAPPEPPQTTRRNTERFLSYDREDGKPLSRDSAAASPPPRPEGASFGRPSPPQHSPSQEKTAGESGEVTPRREGSAPPRKPGLYTQMYMRPSDAPASPGPSDAAPPPRQESPSPQRPARKDPPPSKPGSVAPEPEPRPRRDFEDDYRRHFGPSPKSRETPQEWDRPNTREDAPTPVGRISSTSSYLRRLLDEDSGTKAPRADQRDPNVRGPSIPSGAPGSRPPPPPGARPGEEGMGRFTRVLKGISRDQPEPRRSPEPAAAPRPAPASGGGAEWKSHIVPIVGIAVALILLVALAVTS